MSHKERAYLPDGREVTFPDVKIAEDREEYTYEPLRSHGYVMAVYDGPKSRYIGWIDVTDLGFDSVKDYQKDFESGHAPGRRYRPYRRS